MFWILSRGSNYDNKPLIHAHTCIWLIDSWGSHYVERLWLPSSLIACEPLIRRACPSAGVVGWVCYWTDACYGSVRTWVMILYMFEVGRVSINSDRTSFVFARVVRTLWLSIWLCIVTDPCWWTGLRWASRCRCCDACYCMSLHDYCMLHVFVVIRCWTCSSGHLLMFSVVSLLSLLLLSILLLLLLALMFSSCSVWTGSGAVVVSVNVNVNVNVNNLLGGPWMLMFNADISKYNGKKICWFRKKLWIQLSGGRLNILHLLADV